MTAPLKLEIETPRLITELCTLAMFSQPAPGVTSGVPVTRIVFSPEDTAARAFVEELARDAGLTARSDAIGNTFFRWQGSDPTLTPIATGSHIDAIPNAGMYDGTVGVLGAIAAIRALKSAGFQPQRSIDLILFTSEEPTRFGIGCLGSRLLSGALSAADAAALRDQQGLSLDQARSAAGFSGALDSVRLPPGAYAAFVELHIEQGSVLQHAHTPIGIVTAIAAPASVELTVHGEGGHAGAMLMPARRDALVAAAEIIQATERAALSTGSLDTVATVGLCEVFPGAVNSVPSRVKLTLDVRDIDLARRDSVLRNINFACDEIASRRRLTISRALVNADAPAASDPALIASIEAACVSAETPSQPMISRAYHDTLFMAALCPVAMIFIPCKDGISHRPDEFAAPQDIATGVQVLAGTLALLSAAPEPQPGASH